MNLTKRWKFAILTAAVLFSNSAWAVTPAEETEKECKKPKFRDFLPEHKAEVQPESEISFHVSRGADPATVTATAKGEKMQVNVQDRKTFLMARAKLPATVKGGFARIHVSANAVEGGCLGQDGWLLKIKGEEEAAKPEAEKAGQ